MTRCSWPQAGWASGRPRSGTRSGRRRRASRRPAENTWPRPPTSALAWATATVSRLHGPSRLPTGRWRCPARFTCHTDSAGLCSSCCSRAARGFCFIYSIFLSSLADTKVNSMAWVALFSFQPNLGKFAMLPLCESVYLFSRKKSMKCIKNPILRSLKK